MLAFSGVGRTFPDGTEALRDVDLTVDRGEFVSVVGPSGCGKSTLLRLASGLDHATGGRVDVGSARVGYVFQDPDAAALAHRAQERRAAGRARAPAQGERRARVTRRSAWSA
jgi:NitT/TauT family transport system ATP-binding protein